MFSKLTKTILSLSIFGSSAFAGTMGSAPNPHGFFIGVGGNYNSLRIQQDSWGLGISSLYIDGVYNSTGIAQGNAAPFKNTSQNLSPEVQAGYLRNYNESVYYGIKFTYQYLGAVATNRDLYLPQIGVLTSSSGTKSPMFGYAIADSVETTINHDMNLFALIGKQFGNKSIYLGAGPSLISLQSQNYNSIGYAIVNGETLNVTGLVNYGSPTMWAWGGAAQIGMYYFITPSWFIDASYTFSALEGRISRHEQSFANTSTMNGDNLLTTGILATKDTFKTTLLQSVNVSINRMFDF
ncbi:hypothetical protein Lsai_0111 [Legionella sainthelensi]|uniref:Opacity protein and related surface antigens n=1 Tax=Legionella sainthelensi TaxID=28087 RepID=A0A0W0YU15_9GAMM|nr:hypothetical protein [Legionella sainthelensi]KTD60361.1 hypothetical protein Lsai_0111 [Legionella sainthelensi]VEH34757.1 Uncharacterised protein [Legionella sainthelensi]